MIVAAGTCAFALYLGGYALAFPLRRPAANGFYYYYDLGPSFDRGLFLSFYPLYRLHKASHLPLFWKHNLDRDERVELREMGP